MLFKPLSFKNMPRLAYLLVLENYTKKFSKQHTHTDSAMGPVNCSPNDPVFFLHHCFIDNLFEKFRQRLKEQGYGSN